MSQDLRRERAGAQFDTIAGATNYIAQLEKYRNGEPVFHVIPRDDEMDDLRAENVRLRNFIANIVERGLSADLNPTRPHASEPEAVDGWWTCYIERVDADLRKAAQRVLGLGDV